MDHPALPVLLGQREYLTPADFRGTQDYQVVWAEESVALAKALQRCTVCLGYL